MLIGMSKQLVYAFPGFYNKETIYSNTFSRPHCNNISGFPVKSVGIPSKQVIFQRSVRHVIVDETSVRSFCAESAKTDKIDVLYYSDASNFCAELFLFFNQMIQFLHCYYRLIVQHAFVYRAASSFSEFFREVLRRG